jgi:uncharacterized damage-inducible protein DinB
MPPRKPLNLQEEILEAFERSGRVTEYLVAALPAALWHQPASTGDRGRTIGATFAHIHGVRKMFAKMGGAAPVPALDRQRVSPAQASRALRHINQTLTTMFRESLGRGEARIKGMPRRSINMMAYLIEHDAHHRGQILTRARELGHSLGSDDVMRIWGWKKL